MSRGAKVLLSTTKSTLLLRGMEDFVLGDTDGGKKDSVTVANNLWFQATSPKCLRGFMC